MQWSEYLGLRSWLDILKNSHALPGLMASTPALTLAIIQDLEFVDFGGCSTLGSSVNLCDDPIVLLLGPGLELKR